MLGDRIADAETIDRICRVGGGFRMGPFELMDLVGIDVNFEVAKSFWEQSFHEPRWQPHPIQQRMVSAGRLGRKSGRGYYDYASESHRASDPEVEAPGANAAAREPAPAEIVGEGETAEALRELAGPGAEAPRLVMLAEGSLAELDDAGSSVGFHLFGPLEDARLVELTAGEHSSGAACEGAEGFFRALGLHVEWVGDAPGLVLGRIVCQLVNEAAFAVTAGVGSPDDVDAGMTLGLSHPRGPVAWSRAIGLDHVLAVLDGLASFYREERYRAAPLLRRGWAA
jgi:3-hydroxybutyryl-CoA dehydrogenase